MGGSSSVVGQIANATGTNNLAGGISNEVSKNPIATIGGLVGGPTGALIGGALQPALQSPTAPEAPTQNQDLLKLQQEQQQYADQFSKNLPQMQQQMAKMLSQQSINQTQGQLQQAKQNAQQRGLTYSGINQGNQGAIQANASGNLANSISGANAGLQNASQTLNAQAIETGVGIQQNQQQIQNDIYQQQLASQQANNSIYGGLLGSVATLGLGAAFGGK